jgi:hypothetical protein
MKYSRLWASLEAFQAGCFFKGLKSPIRCWGIMSAAVLIVPMDNVVTILASYLNTTFFIVKLDKT